MKKIFLMLLAALLIVCMAACSSNKQDGEGADETEAAGANQNEVELETGSFEYQLNEEGKCEIVKYTPASVKVVDIELPEKLDDRDVVGIASSAFKAENSIKSITVPATYTYVGDYAFYDCDSLTSVTIKGDAITDIGTSAFHGCELLTSINLPASAKTIGEFAFKDCVSLTEIDLSGVETLGDGAFIGCTDLVNVTVSDAISKISKNAFLGCEAVEYTVENGALYIGNADNKYVVLVSAENLDVDSCQVNAATKVIAEQAFLDCDLLTSVTLGASVTKISASCFEGCVELEYNESENGLYLGTEENPYMVLMSTSDQSSEDFTLNTDTKIICDQAFENYAELQDILYAGTKEDWDAIIKADAWHEGRTTRIVFADESIEPIIYNN